MVFFIAQLIPKKLCTKDDKNPLNRFRDPAKPQTLPQQDLE